MRILLANPPLPGPPPQLHLPPLGLASLAAVAEAAGHEIQILDPVQNGLSVRECHDWIRAYGPWELLGIGSTTAAIDSARDLAEGVQDIIPWRVLGGPHLSGMVQEGCLSLPPGFNLGIPGEGEVPFLSLLAALATRTPGSTEAWPKGILTPGADWHPCLEFADLDRLPPPARHLLPRRGYRHPLAPGYQVSSLITSRGCPFACTFCDHTIFGHRIRYRPMPQVLKEVEALIEDGVDYLIFYDDLLTMNPERLRDLCLGLDRWRGRVAWKCEGRVDHFPVHLLPLMKRSGCDCIALGIESANPSSLDFLNKRTTPAQAWETVLAIRGARIRSLGYFILGIPGESWEDALRTIRWARALRLDFAQFATLNPTPGTALKRWAIQNGRYRETRPLNPFDVDSPKPVIDDPAWPPERLSQIMRQAYREFYFSPGTLARRLLNVRSWRGIGSSLRSMVQLMAFLSHGE